MSLPQYWLISDMKKYVNSFHPFAYLCCGSSLFTAVKLNYKQPDSLGQRTDKTGNILWTLIRLGVSRWEFEAQVLCYTTLADILQLSASYTVVFF